MKLKKANLYALLIVVLVVIVAIGASNYQHYAQEQEAQYVKTVVHVTSLTVIMIPSDYFEVSNSSGCFARNGTEPYESFAITITNRYNQTIDFVNASLALVPDNIVFSDGYTSTDYYQEKYLYQAGPAEAAKWVFPVHVPLYGSAYAQGLAGHTANDVLFDIVISFQVGNITEGPLPVGHDLLAKYNAPSC